MAINDNEKSLAQTISEWAQAGTNVAQMVGTGLAVAQQPKIQSTAQLESAIIKADREQYTNLFENEMALKKLYVLRDKKNLPNEIKIQVDDHITHISERNNKINTGLELMKHMEDLESTMYKGLDTGAYIGVNSSEVLKGDIAGYPEKYKQLESLIPFLSQQDKGRAGSIGNRTQWLYSNLVQELGSSNNLTEREAEALAKGKIVYDSFRKQEDASMKDWLEANVPTYQTMITSAQPHQASLNELSKKYLKKDKFEAGDWGKLNELIDGTQDSERGRQAYAGLSTFSANFQVNQDLFKNKFQDDLAKRHDLTYLPQISPLMSKTPLKETVEIGEASDIVLSVFDKAESWRQKTKADPERQPIPLFDVEGLHTNMNISYNDRRWLSNIAKDYAIASSHAKTEGIAGYKRETFIKNLDVDSQQRLANISNKISNVEKNIVELIDFKDKKPVRKGNDLFIPVMTYTKDGEEVVDFDLSGVSQSKSGKLNISLANPKHMKSLHDKKLTAKGRELNLWDSHLKRYKSKGGDLTIPGMKERGKVNLLNSFGEKSDLEIKYVKYYYNPNNRRWEPAKVEGSSEVITLLESEI